MPNTIMLEERERQLLLELLMAERDELPTEIHHSRVREFRDDLKERRRLVDELIERLQRVPVS